MYGTLQHYRLDSFMTKIPPSSLVFTKNTRENRQHQYVLIFAMRLPWLAVGLSLTLFKLDSPNDKCCQVKPKL